MNDAKNRNGDTSPHGIPHRNDGSAGDIALPENTISSCRTNSPDEPLPKRKKLPHKIPSWVEQGARHFITLNCKTRTNAPLFKSDLAVRLINSAKFYDQSGKWHLWLMLIMPDHIHFIATFNLTTGLRPTVTAWKRYQAKTLGIDWQSDFFEHRLRNQAEFDEKAHYIRMNPVRKNLVTLPEQWPHVLDRTKIEDGSFGELAPPTEYKNNR